MPARLAERHRQPQGVAAGRPQPWQRRAEECRLRAVFRRPAAARYLVERRSAIAERQIQVTFALGVGSWVAQTRKSWYNNVWMLAHFSAAFLQPARVACLPRPKG